MQDGKGKMQDFYSTQIRIAAQAQAFKVAAIQMASGPNVAGNLAEAGRLVEKAADQGAKLVVLPEYFPIMGMTDTDKIAVREKPGEGPIQSFLSETARRHRIWLVRAACRCRAGQGAQQLPGVRRERQAGGPLRQDPPVQP